MADEPLILKDEPAIGIAGNPPETAQAVEAPLVATPRGGKCYLFLKRAFDIVVSFVALCVLLLPMLLVSVAIVIDSPGSPIYVSRRIGKDGREFRFFKFRSMYKDADRHIEELLKYNEVDGGVTFKMKDDPRITRVGKFLRKTSIDELPQLLNIFLGDMSFVGPRPCTLREYALYSERDKLRLLVPQGLTGEWQVHGRSNTTFAEMIDMDLSYITEKQSLFYDICLMFATVGAVLSHKGAE